MRQQLYRLECQLGPVDLNLLEDQTSVACEAIPKISPKREESKRMALYNKGSNSCTTEGMRLYEFIRPAFERLAELSNHLAVPRLSIAASGVVLREFLRQPMDNLRRRYERENGIELYFKEAPQPEAIRLIQAGKVDLAITLEPSDHPNIRVTPLLSLRPTVLVKGSPQTENPLDLLRDTKPGVITFEHGHPIRILLEEFLGEHLKSIRVTMEVTSPDLIECYVEGGVGVGFSVFLPNHPWGNLSPVLLPGSHVVKIAAVTGKRPNRQTLDAIEILQKAARELETRQTQE